MNKQELSEKIVQARKVGNSVVITVTDFLEEGKFYKLKKEDDKITIKELLFVEKDDNI